MQIQLASVDSIIIYFGDTISNAISSQIRASYKVLKSLNNQSFIEIIPSYSSILITYDVFTYSFEEMKILIEKLLKNVTIENEKEKNIIEIDVYYGQEVGFDLQRVATHSKLSIEDVIKIHSSKVYNVYAIGFLPGFAYMASVDKKIITPRLSTPRTLIPKGSVAIADTQTAIYPQNSPGGWNILGKTTFELFDKSLLDLSPVSIETKIKFNPISKEKFLKQGGVLEF